MARITDQRLYTLTSRDVERIQGLLQSVEEAVIEIMSFRCVRPVDRENDFPMEDAVYQQTSQIMRDFEDPSLKNIF